MGPKYTKQAAICRQRAQKHETSQGSMQSSSALAQAQSYEDLKNKTDFTDWFETDRRLFAQMDADNNKSLDKDEFKNLMKHNFGIKDEQAATIYAKFDVDQQDSIGIYEFCQMMSVWHGQLVYYEMKHAGEAEWEVYEGAIPCMCCDGFCVKRSCEFGLFCSLCTLGLSWIPCYCILQASAINLNDSEHLNKELEKARAEGVKAAKKSTAKKLEAGPPANVLKPADCAKK